MGGSSSMEVQRSLERLEDPRIFLAGLFEHSPVAYQIYGVDGHCVLVNRAFLELFGSAPPPEYNLLQDDVLERQGFLALVRRAFDGETIRVPAHWYDPRDLRQVEVRAGRRAGIEATLFPIPDREGKARYIALTVKDVSAELALRETSLELQRSEQRFRATFEQAAVGIAHVATDGRWLEVNQRLCDIVGYTRAELLQRNFQDITHPADLDADLDFVRQVLEQRISTYSMEKRYVHKDGRLIWIELTVSLVRDTSGAPEYFISVVQDISARKAAEERLAQTAADLAAEERALRVSEARKSAIMEAALDCIVTADQTLSITEFNPAAERTFGYPRAYAIGRPLPELLVPHSLRERHREGFRRYLATGVGPILGKRVEIQALHADGREFPVELAVVPTHSDQGQFFTAYIRDLTERQRTAQALQVSEEERERTQEALRQSEEQLRQSQKMEAVGTLAGSISHDFNNLLSVIMGYVDLIQQQLPDADPLNAELEQIERAARRANDLTRQLLAFSRQQVLKPRVVNLNQSIAHMTRMLQRLIGEDVELILSASPSLGNVYVDPAQIEQVLLNLLVNARDAMPRGGKLIVETCNVDLDSAYAATHLDVLAGSYVMLSVSDTGSGMDRATQGRIFEPFFTTKEMGKGTGLGLSTVFGIVKQSGGHIWVYSELGQGTTFKVYLPRTDAGVDMSERTGPPPATLQGAETILLAEDDEQVRTLTVSILRKHGYHVLEAASGADALSVCEQFSGVIHLLLTDVVMPRMSGRELWERLAPLRPAMKVVFMSGYTDDAIVHHGVVSSEFGFLQKPLLPGKLLGKLRQVLDAERAR